jgi:tRNA-splicing ligase RtcB
MNRRQLLKMGLPEYAVADAILGIQSATQLRGMKGKAARQRLAEVIDDPAAHLDDLDFGALAKILVEYPIEADREPLPYKTWGAEFIEQGSHQQMREACRLPNAVGAALMPDAHVGYGLPIGGVLALENAVCPYAVGVDIACRMKLSILDMPGEMLDQDRHFERFRSALENGTVFGVGKKHPKKQYHEVLDRDWSITRITRESKDKAAQQLGTSGSGNHFVEFGTLTIDKPELGLEPGSYVAILSHSGSRGPGSAVCSTYSDIARAKLHKRYEQFDRLAWLDLDSEPGAEYWAAMNLMGEYAAANHACIHQLVTSILGVSAIAGVENHHNFAWKETHFGREVIVHRKGATPAGAGVLGVIPGSMASPGFVVRGKGNPESLHSASHGAGRVMSRTQARNRFRFNAVKNDLERKGIKVLSAGADEVPGVYKDIYEVMAAQHDLVEIVARFDPKIVKMCDDGSRAED